MEREEEAPISQEDSSEVQNTDSSEDEDGHVLNRRQRMRWSKDMFFELYNEVIRGLVWEQNRALPSFSDVSLLIRKVLPLFQKENSLVELDSRLPHAIHGDLHGNINSLVRAYKHYKGDRSGFHPARITRRFVCLGNYVDGGSSSVHVLMILFSMKICCPDAVILIRGNHEIRSVNAVNGFKAELEKTFNQEQATELFDQFNEVFDHMPLACLIGGKILCVHGGISPVLTSMDDIRNIPKPLKHPNRHQLACDLHPMIGLRGFIPNAIRGRSVHFGEDVLESTMLRLGVRRILRGNEIIYKGVSNFHGSRLVTLTTGTNIHRNNYGGVLLVKEDCDMKGDFLMSPLPEGEADYGKYDHLPDHAVFGGRTEILSVNTVVRSLISRDEPNETREESNENGEEMNETREETNENSGEFIIEMADV